MTRRAWLIFSVALLFGAQVPLCAFACIEQAAAPESIAMAGHQAPEIPPCHGSAPTTPESPASDEHECRCGQLDLVLSKGDGTQTVDTVKAPSPPPAMASLETPAPAQPTMHLRDRHRSLPPPDILLLKSTLLL